MMASSPSVGKAFWWSKKHHVNHLHWNWPAIFYNITQLFFLLRKRRSPEKDACSFQEEWHVPWFENMGGGRGGCDSQPQRTSWSLRVAWAEAHPNRCNSKTIYGWVFYKKTSTWNITSIFLKMILVFFFLSTTKYKLLYFLGHLFPGKIRPEAPWTFHRLMFVVSSWRQLVCHQGKWALQTWVSLRGGGFYERGYPPGN